MGWPWEHLNPVAAPIIITCTHSYIKRAETPICQRRKRTTDTSFLPAANAMSISESCTLVSWRYRKPQRQIERPALAAALIAVTVQKMQTRPKYGSTLKRNRYWDGNGAEDQNLRTSQGWHLLSLPASTNRWVRARTSQGRFLAASPPNDLP